MSNIVPNEPLETAEQIESYVEKLILMGNDEANTRSAMNGGIYIKDLKSKFYELYSLTIFQNQQKYIVYLFNNQRLISLMLYLMTELKNHDSNNNNFNVDSIPILLDSIKSITTTMSELNPDDEMYQWFSKKEMH